MSVNPPVINLVLVEMTKGGLNLYFDHNYRKAWPNPVPGSSLRTHQRTFRKIHFPYQWDYAQIIDGLEALSSKVVVKLQDFEVIQTLYHKRHSYILGVGDIVHKRKTNVSVLQKFETAKAL